VFILASGASAREVRATLICDDSAVKERRYVSVEPNRSNKKDDMEEAIAKW
jgi:hypothetical protein